eukprot:11652172-Ditylum_brightwellii.AAC.2
MRCRSSVLAGLAAKVWSSQPQVEGDSGKTHPMAGQHEAGMGHISSVGGRVTHSTGQMSRSLPGRSR